MLTIVNPQDLDDARHDYQSVREGRTVAYGKDIAIRVGVPGASSTRFTRADLACFFINAFQRIFNVSSPNADSGGVTREESGNLPTLHNFKNRWNRQYLHC